jgi:hypothetical protein
MELIRSLDSLVKMAIRLQAGRSGVRFPVRERNFSFLEKSKRTLGPTQLPSHWVPVFFL